MLSGASLLIFNKTRNVWELPMGEGHVWWDLLAKGQTRLQHVNGGRKWQGPSSQRLPVEGCGWASGLQRRFETLAGVRQTAPNPWKLQFVGFFSGYLCSFSLNTAVASETRGPRFFVDVLTPNLVCFNFFVEHIAVSHGRALHWIHLPHGTIVSSGSTAQHRHLVPA